MRPELVAAHVTSTAPCSRLYLIALEKSRDRYVDLYDFSPVGYLTLSREGMISEINLTGATLLGIDRKKLINRRFSSLVTFEDNDLWHQHFIRVIQHGEQQSCELALQRGDGSRFSARLDCGRTKTDNEFSIFIALADSGVGLFISNTGLSARYLL